MANKKEEIYVGNYTVNARHVIGLGSFGVIFTARDHVKDVVAAKRIDLSEKKDADQLVKDLQELVKLDHPNILRYYNVVKEEDICWLFMDFCPCGDLGKFFTSTKPDGETILKAMAQLAQGTEYLHSKNIVHRDIKPANILVASTSPFQVKLTDFDLSKFLDDDVTSKMSSNVGTTAFKAPEFFMRNDQKKLEYHRSVDIYALGLTYLAMIQGNKPLMPKLETAKDSSELHNPIGSTMAVRLKYGVKPLTVLPTGSSDTSIAKKLLKALRLQNPSASSGLDSSSNPEFGQWMRDLILNMTRIKPDERPTASEVLRILQQFTQTPSRITFARCVKWYSELDTISMCINGRDQLILRGMKDDEQVIQVCNRDSGNVLREIPDSDCKHYNPINEVPMQPDFILKICGVCDIVRLYDTKTKKSTASLKMSKPWRICTKSEDSVLVIDLKGLVTEIRIGKSCDSLEAVRTMQSDAHGVQRISYDSYTDFCIIADLINSGRVQALCMKDGAKKWELSGEVEGNTFHPRGICCNKKGHVFVGDSRNGRLLILDSTTGKLLQTVQMQLKLIWKLQWSDTKPELTILHDLEAISCLAVEE